MPKLRYMPGVELIDLEKGEFSWSERRGIRYLCVWFDGAEGPVRLSTYRDGELKPTSVAWLWDGVVEAPTLHPSVFISPPTGWHGWLRAGVSSLA